MNILITNFEKSEGEIRKIRNCVFRKEQNIPEEIDWDGKDNTCIHALAIENQKPVGTGRVTLEGKIGRIAVLKDYRSKGIGTLLLNALIEAANSKGINKVHLHAQLQAIGFYKKEGFKSSGNTFFEADIEHIYMSKGT